MSELPKGFTIGEKPYPGLEPLTTCRKILLEKIEEELVKKSDLFPSDQRENIKSMLFNKHFLGVKYDDKTEDLLSKIFSDDIPIYIDD